MCAVEVMENITQLRGIVLKVTESKFCLDVGEGQVWVVVGQRPLPPVGSLVEVRGRIRGRRFHRRLRDEVAVLLRRVGAPEGLALQLGSYGARKVSRLVVEVVADEVKVCEPPYEPPAKFIQTP